MAALTPFKITTDLTDTYVEVNGVDVSDGTTAVRFEHEQGGMLPVLTLWRQEHAGSINGTAIVHVVNDGADPVEVIRGFLATVDPVRLETEALEGAGMGVSVTAAILIRLGELAGES